MADLTEAGHKVAFWRRNSVAVGKLRQADNRIELVDHQGRREVRVALVTDDMAAALSQAELIICPVPAFGQIDIARAMAPHLTDGQVVLLPPGSFGSYCMAKEISRAGNRCDIAFAESGTLPYLARLHGEHSIAITTRATRLPTGVFPLRLHDHALTVIRRAYPSVEDAGDGLSGALMNAGPIIHPPLIMMNAGPIQHFEHWDIHNEGTQPAIRRVTDKLDAERIAVRQALGYAAPHFPLADHYNPDGEEWMYGNVAHERLVDSGDWRENLVLTEHRYMREDVEYGLALLVSLAQWLDVQAPVATGLLALGSAVCGQDFNRSGRTVTALGIDSIDTLRQQLDQGF